MDFFYFAYADSVIAMRIYLSSSLASIGLDSCLSFHDKIFAINKVPRLSTLTMILCLHWELQSSIPFTNLNGAKMIDQILDFYIIFTGLLLVFCSFFGSTILFLYFFEKFIIGDGDDNY